MNLLLDTCTFLWLSREPNQLSTKASEYLDDSSNERFLSEVSVMDMVMKNSAGKLPFSDEPKQWIPSRLSFHQIKTLPITDTVIYLSGELGKVHRDPFDRLITAHAITESLTVISPDGQLSNLGASRIW